MKKNRILAAVISAAVAVSALAVSVFAADDLILDKDGWASIPKISDPTANAVFVTDTLSRYVGGEDDGAWVIGGDNNDVGISQDMLKEYKYLEFDYTAETPVAGVMIGLSFKVHVSLDSRTCDDGGYIFADFLPAIWVPYGSGADGKQPIMAVNSLETIYQTPLTESGTISIPIETLLAAFPEDFDYIMGIGIGANNNSDYISEEDLDNESEYVVTLGEFRLVSEASENVAPNANDLSEDEIVALIEEAYGTAEETTEATTTAAPETEAATEATTTAATTAAAPAASSNNTTMIILIIVAAVVVAGIIIAVVVVNKKKY